MGVNVKNEGISISASRDGAMFNCFAGNSDFVIKGIGSELAVTYSASSFTVTLGTGEAVICGRSLLSSIELPTVTLGANASGYLVVEVDLSQTGANICQFKSVNTLTYENINNTGLKRDLLLYEYTTDSNGVSAMVDKRVLQDASASGTKFLPNATLSTTWTLDSTSNKYYQDITITGITADNVIDINPITASLTKAQEEAYLENFNKLCANNETIAGGLRVYANESISTAITVELRLVK